DLHAHSDRSDGTDPPAEVVRNARAAGLDVVALTDHDTTAGWDDAAAALPDGLTLVRGAEVSCLRDGLSLHLLAYLFDPDDAALRAELDRIRTDRDRRARDMVARLNDLGVAVTYERVAEISGGGAIGRPHVARAMVEAGVVEDVAGAFTDEWIGNDGRAYVEKYSLDPRRAVELVNAAGGVAVFAHPGAVKRGRVVGEDVIADLADAGLAALEVDHPDHEPGTRERLRALARDLGLLTTGSSDDHGSLTGRRLGRETTAPEVWEALRGRASGVAPFGTPEGT
ncbi:MAG TPA: PHP domain-containing protein, partial [Frankiaceae bacterium]|nr:PHP domain-containing protein [Frankiaceae bacterium]